MLEIKNEEMILGYSEFKLGPTGSERRCVCWLVVEEYLTVGSNMSEN